MGENYHLFIEPMSSLSAKYRVVLDGRGNMTAPDDPERASREIIVFLRWRRWTSKTLKW
jgi:hypothetical protein